MVGEPPSARGGRPADPGLHAQQIAREWEDVGESYVRRRNRELGVPNDMNAEAIKNAATTELPISDEARRLNRARAR